VARLKTQLKQAEKNLNKLQKKNSDTLFAGGFVVELPRGRLIRQAGDVVKRLKGVKVAKVKAAIRKLGWMHLIKRDFPIDGDAVKKLSDDDLAKIHYERQPDEKFTYDLKENGRAK